MTLDSGWKRTIDDGIANPEWDAYDALLRNEIGPLECSVVNRHYNARFIADAQRTRYPGVDWKLAKAMLWVESGGPKGGAWVTRPMQIGNPGDPAYAVVKGGRDGSAIVMSAELAKAIKSGSIDQPQLNVRAGIAYLFTRMAQFDMITVHDPVDSSIQLVRVQPGDSLERIAKRVGTTVEILSAMRKVNSSSVLRIGEALQYRKAKLQLSIVGWRSWDYATIAARYNGGGDKHYAEKLEYVHAGLFPKLVR